MKAVIFDLDGTAIPNEPNGVPSQKLIDTIKSAQGSIKLCAATGRPITNGKYILSALNLKDPCIIAGGSQIIDPITDEIIWRANCINSNDLDKILEICEPYDYEILLDDELAGEGKTAIEHAGIDKDVSTVCVMACTKPDAEAILERLKELPDIMAAGVTSWTADSLDIHVTHREATKEHAVNELLRQLSINKDEVVGVGDANNDVHLFAAVGYKVAMGNATDTLKALADEVTDSVQDDGLAKTISKFSNLN